MPRALAAAASLMQVLEGSALEASVATEAHGVQASSSISQDTVVSGRGAVGRRRWCQLEALQPALALVAGSRLNLLLVFCPLGVAAKPMGLGASLVFFLNFLAIIPLAQILGDATEHLAVHVGQTLGGLLNATLGNAVEMIIAVFALQKGLIEVVQGTLLGSILSNLLLVLGCSFVVGGMKYEDQKFNATGAAANSSLLLVACMALLLPTCFSSVQQSGCVADEATRSFIDTVIPKGKCDVMPDLTPAEAKAYGPICRQLTIDDQCNLLNETCTWRQSPKPVEPRLVENATAHAWTQQCFKELENSTVVVSRITSVLLCTMYVQYLYFQLVSHKHLFEDVGDEEEEQESEAALTKGAASCFLAASALLVAANSEALVGSLDSMSTEMGIGHHFIGIVLLPVVGNAAEHVTAVGAAAKNKMNLALGVAVGSSTQVALCVVPFTVLVGILVCPEGKPMSLDFHVFASAVLLMSVLIVNVTIAKGSSNWLDGSLLVHCYLIVAATFWCMD